MQRQRSLHPNREREQQRRRAEKQGIQPAYLGHSAKRTLKRYPSCRLTHLDLVNEGWVAAAEAIAKGVSLEVAHRRAETRMKAAAFADQVPLSGDTKKLRKLRFVDELHPSYPQLMPGRFARRLTPGDWRALKALFRRVLAPQEATILQRCVCERASVLEVAHELGLTFQRASTTRSVAIAKVLRAAGLKAA